MLKRWRPYRMACVAVVLVWILPQYLWLLRRQRVDTTAPSQERWDRVHQRCAAAIHFIGVHLRGLFVKLCQVVGARRDVLPAVFGERLSRFHDRVPPRSLSALRSHVERQLGRPLGEVFASLEEQPMAAASLAQVHRGTLRDGTTVAVKIQYPEIEKTARVDLRSLRMVGWVVSKVQDRFDLRSIVEELARFLALEVDFVREAASTARVAANFGSPSEVRIPLVHTELSGRKLLVLEYLDGIKVTEVEALRASGHDPEAIAARVGRAYATMLFEHGFFHGDPHPGNLLVMPDGRLGLLDFGLAKELPPGFGPGVAAMFRAAMSGNLPGALDQARALGFELPANTGAGLSVFVGMLLGQPNSGASLLDALGESPVGKIPEHFGLVARTLILLNGLSHSLAPQKRVIQLEMLAAMTRLAQPNSGAF